MSCYMSKVQRNSFLVMWYKPCPWSWSWWWCSWWWSWSWWWSCSCLWSSCEASALTALSILKVTTTKDEPIHAECNKVQFDNLVQLIRKDRVMVPYVSAKERKQKRKKGKLPFQIKSSNTKNIIKVDLTILSSLQMSHSVYTLHLS